MWRDLIPRLPRWQNGDGIVKTHCGCRIAVFYDSAAAAVAIIARKLAGRLSQDWRPRLMKTGDNQLSSRPAVPLRWRQRRLAFAAAGQRPRPPVQWEPQIIATAAGVKRAVKIAFIFYIHICNLLKLRVRNRSGRGRKSRREFLALICHFLTYQHLRPSIRTCDSGIMECLLNKGFSSHKGLKVTEEP